MQMVDFDAKFNASISSYIWIPGVPRSHVIAHKHITNHAYPHGTVYKNRIVYADIRPNLCGHADIRIYVVMRSIYSSQIPNTLCRSGKYKHLFAYINAYEHETAQKSFGSGKLKVHIHVNSVNSIKSVNSVSSV